MKAKICVPVAAETTSKVIELIERAESLGADLIEVRFDYLNLTGEIRRIARSTPLPLIATNRRFDQGGRRRQDESDRIRSLLDASKHGFEYVDLELNTPGLRSVVEKVRSLGSEVILSYHNFDCTPQEKDLEKIVEEMVSKGANICKVVTTARKFEDNLVCLNLLKNVTKKFRVTCFAMGELGLLSRLLSPLVGGYFTYASIAEDLATAPGQVSIREMKEFYEVFGV
ncbi:type I 3-dehydroquinate dehydratase [Candidatus Bathyarchaeota archaeon]|nr:type I 3-dehydroquinate dehydratase [Candidatus Bathyarchaeota archaeon]